MAGDREWAVLTADVVLIGVQDRVPHVLLIRRAWSPYQGMWALPGGHVDAGETTEAAAVRELVEETGLAVDGLGLVGVYATPGRDPRGRYVTWAYTAGLADLVEPTAGDDAAGARWVPINRALAAPLAFDHHVIVRDAMAGHDRRGGRGAGTPSTC